MILSEKQVEEKLTSPFNLMNKLKSMPSGRRSAMQLFVPSLASQEKKFNPTFQPASPASPQLETPSLALATPTIESLVPNADKQVELALAHDRALTLLNTTITMLATKLDDVRPDRLPQVISATSKVVESIRRERLETTKSGINKEVHYHFYTPEQNKITDYEIIDVAASASSDQASA